MRCEPDGVIRPARLRRWADDHRSLRGLVELNEVAARVRTHGDRLVNVWSTAPGLDYKQFQLSPDLFLFYQKRNAVFEDMALFRNRRVNLTESGPPELISASVITHNYFATL